MKKNLYLGLAVLASLSMTSCSNDEYVEGIPQQETIEFGTYMGREIQGRGVELDNSNLLNFGVFASYTGEADWTNTNMNFKITWPFKEGMIEDIHPVQMENITTSINNNIAKTIESNVDNSRIKYHSNFLADVNLQIDGNNFKSVSTDGIENVIIMLQGIENLDQDDEGVKKVIFFHPDTFTTDRRKGFSFNPDIDYAQTAGNKIILPSGITDMFNSLVKYKKKALYSGQHKPHQQR